MSTTHIQNIKKTIPRYGDYFGGTVKFSYDGGTLICTAASFDGSFNYNIPTLSVYTLINGQYSYHSDLVFPSDMLASDHAVVYAKINRIGTVILVNANNYINVNGPVGPNGGIFVYHLVNNSWILVNTITAIPPNNTYNHQYDKFGFFFDTTDDFRTMIASAPFDNSNSSFGPAGTVYIMESSDNWITHTEKEQIGDPIAGGVSNFFGYNCTISGDGNLCSVSANSKAPPTDVLVNHYKKISGVFVYQNSSASIDSPAVNNFGSAQSSSPTEFSGVSLAMSNDGEILVIGDYINQSNKGSFYILKKIGDSYTYIHSEISSAFGDLMGYSVAVDEYGSVVVVGLQGKNVSGNAAQGAIRIYNVDGLDVTFQEEISAPYLQLNSYGGFKVDISPDGKYIAAGSIQDVVSGISLAGSVNVWSNKRSPGARNPKYFIYDGKFNKQ